jgi:hypothetical protein
MSDIISFVAWLMTVVVMIVQMIRKMVHSSPLPIFAVEELMHDCSFNYYLTAYNELEYCFNMPGMTFLLHFHLHKESFWYENNTRCWLIRPSGVICRIIDILIFCPQE